MTVEGGYKLSYRDGYFADEPSRPFEGPRKVLGLNGEQTVEKAQDAAPIDFTVAVNIAAGGETNSPGVEAAAAFKVPSEVYDLEYKIPLRELQLHDEANGHQTSALRIEAFAFDRNGKILGSNAESANAQVPQLTGINVAQTFVRVKQLIRLPTGSLYLFLRINDEGSARSGTLEVPVDVSVPRALHAASDAR